ncbi:MAG: serine hydrolase domain-containing protein [Thermoanaerobaculia bacterium]
MITREKLKALGSLVLFLTAIPVLVQGQSEAPQEPQAPVAEAAVRASVMRLLDELGRGAGKDHEAFVKAEFVPRLVERFGVEMLAHIVDDMATMFGATDAPVLNDLSRGSESGWWVADVTGGSDDRLRMQFQILGSEPKFTGFEEMKLAPPSNAKEADLPVLAEAFVKRKADGGEFSGAVLVSKNGKPLFAGSYGMADRSTSRPNTLDTPINLGSMNKVFTGIAIGQLHAKGLLDWDDKVGKHLPDFPNKTVRDQVTIRQLLTHTSGVPSYWNPKYEANKNELRTLKDFLNTFVDEPLLFEPGKGNEYSNGGPIILGLIIEKLSGESYFDYVRKHIYEPAGMTRTAHYAKNDAKSGMATGYMRQSPDAPFTPNTPTLGRIGSSAGGGYSTANDLLRFSIALGNGKLLPGEELEILWGDPEKGHGMGYGFLWGTGLIEGHRWVGHNGGAPGISADFRYFPETGYAVVVLANQDHAAMPLSDWLCGLVASVM